MAAVSFPTVLCSARLVSNSALFFPESKKSHNPIIPDNLRRRNCISVDRRSLLDRHLIETSLSSRHKTGFRLDATSSSSLEEANKRSLETVLKLYSAIKNRNNRELADLIGDECRCICNFLPFFQTFQGKQQVLAFFIFLMHAIGNNIELVLQPTLHDGLHVSVRWKLEWNRIQVPLGKGFAFHILQVYHGKVLLRNVEMSLDPILHAQQLRLKIMGCIKSIKDKISSKKLCNDMMKRSLLITVLVSVILLFTLF